MKNFLKEVWLQFEIAADLHGWWFVAGRVLISPIAAVWLLTGYVCTAIGNFIENHPI